MIAALPLPGAPNFANYPTAEDWRRATHAFLDANETKFEAEGIVAPRRSHRCLRCQDKGFELNTGSDGRPYAIPCKHQKAGASRHHFPAGIAPEGSYPTAECRDVALSGPPGSAIWISGGKHTDQLRLAMLICDTLIERDKQRRQTWTSPKFTPARYFEAVLAPKEWGDEWQASTSSARVLVIGRIDRSLAPAQAAAVAELMNHNRDKTMILLGEPIGTLSAERFVPITLALGARNAAAVDLNPSDRNQPAPAGNEPFFE